MNTYILYIYILLLYSACQNKYHVVHVEANGRLCMAFVVVAML